LITARGLFIFLPLHGLLALMLLFSMLARSLQTVDNQLVQPKVLLKRLIFVAIAIVVVMIATVVALRSYQMSDPYIHNVLTLEGDPVRGQAIFETNCAGCHGASGAGHVGPSLNDIAKRRSDFNLIHQVISGKTPPMPKFQPKPQDMADLLKYLEEL
jgi:mono/diheme cytochrome c family protein